MSSGSLSILLAGLLGLTYFIWPLYHAISGNNRKARILRKIFFALLLGSFLCGIGIAYEFAMGFPHREGWLGYVMLIEMLVALSLIGSLVVLLFLKSEAKAH